MCLFNCNKVTISSSQIGHTSRRLSLALTPVPDGPPPLEGPTAKLTLETRSCGMSGRGTDEDGEMESRVEFGETKETVLLSEGANGLTAR